MPRIGYGKGEGRGGMVACGRLSRRVHGGWWMVWWLVMVLVGMRGLAVGQVPALVDGELWVLEIATQQRWEGPMSHSELNYYMSVYPYWYPVDSASLARMNRDMGRFKPYRFEREVVERKYPGYWDRCGKEDPNRGPWFESPLDSVVRHSGFGGSREEIIRQECICMLTMPKYVLRGRTAAGDEVLIYIGTNFGGREFFLYTGEQYYRRKGRSSDRFLPNWLQGWKSEVIPPPLPNWPEVVRKRYLESR